MYLFQELSVLSHQKIEEYSHNLSRNLASSLLENDYRIVNGIGRRFGTHLIGYANEYLAKQGVKDIEKHLIVKPFVGNTQAAAEENTGQEKSNWSMWNSNFCVWRNERKFFSYKKRCHGRI